MKASRLIASTAVVAATTIFARLFGFLREITLAATYGAGMVSDAFIIAFTVPSIVLAVVAASTSAAFIPMYTRLEDGKNKFTNNVLSLLAIIGLVFSLVFTFVPQALTFLFASRLDAETFAIATKLMRIMVWTAVPVLFVGILQSYLQIQKAFFLAAILVLPVNIAAIISISLSESLNMTELMGFGVVAGNVLMLLFLLLAVKLKGHRFCLVLDIRTPRLREFVMLLTPVLVATVITDIHVIIDRNFASTLVVGSISSLHFAARTVSILTVLFGASLATVLFPRMSELAAQGNTEDIQYYISAYIRKFIPLLLPAIIGIITLAEPIIRILFERGDFLQEDTVRTTQSLQMYAPMLLSASFNAVLIRTFFSLHDTKTPAVILLISLAVSIALNFLLIQPLQHMGLALSSSVSGWIATILLLGALKKRFGTLRLKPDGFEWFKIAIATAIMGAIVWMGSRFLPVMDGGMMQSLLLTLGLVLAGIGIYILAHLAMRSVFVSDMLTLIRGAFRFREK